MKDKIKHIVAAVFEADEKKINESTIFSDFPTYDSMRFINLLSAIENEFNINIDFEAIQNLTTYKQVEDLILKNS
jgi:acyl carrier protein